MILRSRNRRKVFGPVLGLAVLLAAGAPAFAQYGPYPGEPEPYGAPGGDYGEDGYAAPPRYAAPAPYGEDGYGAPAYGVPAPSYGYRPPGYAPRRDDYGHRYGEDHRKRYGEPRRRYDGDKQPYGERQARPRRAPQPYDGDAPDDVR